MHGWWTCNRIVGYNEVFKCFASWHFYYRIGTSNGRTELIAGSRVSRKIWFEDQMVHHNSGACNMESALTAVTGRLDCWHHGSLSLCCTIPGHQQHCVGDSSKGMGLQLMVEWKESVFVEASIFC